MDHPYQKHFIPLESNPEVFKRLIQLLGAPPSLLFEDVLSLDEAELLPHPALALILVFPTTESYEHSKVAEDETNSAACTENDEDIVWFKQTINNACGLYGVLHALSNGAARNLLEPGSLLTQLLESCSSSPAEQCYLVSEKSKPLEDIYAEVAKRGSSNVPDNAEDEVNYHYVCFVKSHRTGHLYELDGDRQGPVDRGQVLRPEDDVLAEGGLAVIREYIKHGKGDIGFGLMALVESGEK